MTDEGHQRTILLKDGLPISAVILRIVEILALNTPRLAINLFPLSARVDAHLHLREVQWSIAHPHGRGAIRGHDAPTGSATGRGLIKKFLLVMRKRVRANAFKEWCGGARTELVSLQAKWRRSRRGRL